MSATMSRSISQCFGRGLSAPLGSGVGHQRCSESGFRLPDKGSETLLQDGGYDHVVPRLPLTSQGLTERRNATRNFGPFVERATQREPFGRHGRRKHMKIRLLGSSVAMLVLVTACAGVDDGSGATSTTTTIPGGVEGPVFIDSTEILYLESFPVQVRLLVRGSLPTPCHEAVWAVDDLGSTIDVRLWSSVLLGQACAQVLEPFEVSIPLGAFESATSSVVVNGEEIGRLAIGVETAVEEASLVEAGWSFGMCLGFCNADLAIQREGLVLTARDREKQEPLYVNSGSLTVVGLERIGAAVEHLSAVALDPVYGCPDCADGGASYLVLEREGVSVRHDMEFGSPPEVLAELQGLAMEVIEALETCGSNELVTVADDCVPWEGF